MNKLRNLKISLLKNKKHIIKTYLYDMFDKFVIINSCSTIYFTLNDRKTMEYIKNSNSLYVDYDIIYYIIEKDYNCGDETEEIIILLTELYFNIKIDKCYCSILWD